MPSRMLRPSAPPSTSFTLYRSDDPMSVKLHKVDTFDSVELALKHLRDLYPDQESNQAAYWSMGIMYVHIPDTNTVYEIMGD